MKKLSLVLLLWLSACCLVFGQVSSTKRALFTEALNTLGKRVPSGWTLNNDMYWKSFNANDIVTGKEYTTVQVNGNIVYVAMVGCSVANTNAQARWIKESYDTLSADGWKLFSGNANDFVLSKGDNLATSIITNDGSTLTAAVVFMTEATARAASGPNWTAVSNPRFGTSNISAIAYGGSGTAAKFVAAGYDGKMATSTDGVTWAAIDVSRVFNDGIYAIAWGNNRFVAGGSGGRMATSSNGTAWTAVDVSRIFGRSIHEGLSGARISGIAYGGSGTAAKFVAVSSEGTMATSPDGTTWTAVDVSKIFGSTPINAIAWGGNRFVAVGGRGTGDGGISIVATSPNGTTWTDVDVRRVFGDYYKNAIAYGNNKFVAGGIGGTIATSTNGTTWTAVADSKFGSSGISAIAYGNNKFVACDYSGKIVTSTDGTTWTAVADSKFGTSYISAIAYGSGKFVAVGADGKMAYLPD